MTDPWKDLASLHTTSARGPHAPTGQRFRFIKMGLKTLSVVVVTLLALKTIEMKHRPALGPWHQTVLAQEFHADQYPTSFSFDDYLKLEDRLFQELDERIESQVAPSAENIFNRYNKKSLSSPLRFEQNWNRSFEWKLQKLKGAVVLFHGLTDSPYSMKALAEVFFKRGYYVLVPRLPGHGTTPATLRDTHFQDWQRVVQMALRHARKSVGTEVPLYAGGYSNGGLLTINTALTTLESGEGERIEKIFLLSPAMGVTGLARFGHSYQVLDGIPYFKKNQWYPLLPEYDPFKYNSFPKRAGRQIYLLSKLTQKQIERCRQKGTMAQFPPVLAFASVVDSTVLTPALVDGLFAQLPDNGSELVLYDTNRFSPLSGFMKQTGEDLLDRLAPPSPLPYRFTRITNASSESLEVVARSRSQGPWEPVVPLNLSWPRGVFSLSHVALPFSPNDLLYGERDDLKESGQLLLGAMEPRGETNVLSVSVEQLMRLRYNPFFSYLEEKVLHFIDTNPKGSGSSYSNLRDSNSR